MARIALIKLFTGLNLGVSQLSGELQRAGHDSLIIYLKDHYVVPAEELHRHAHTEYAGIAVGPRGKELVWNCYKPITEREYRLLLDALKDFRPDLVGFSLTSSGFDLAGEVTRHVKKEFGVPVIWGGSGPTLEPERCLSYADLICINEGEEVIVELARRIDAERELTGIPGVWGFQNGNLVKTPDRPLLDIENLAFPDFEPKRTLHIENDKVTRNVYPENLGKQYVIMTSRGCPFSCSFCVESVYQDKFGKKGSLRRRSVDLVIEELVLAKQRYGVKSVMFYDDVFTTHRKWLQEFAPRYKAEVGLPFWCYTYPTTTRREDLELLADAGCVSMTIGVQSGSERVLKEHFNRPAPLDQAREAMQMILDANIRCFFDLITAVEFETEEDVRSTFEFLLTLPRGVISVGFGRMVQFPGYGYTARVAESARRHALSEADYRYYHMLYWIALSELPHSAKVAIGRDPLFRKNPELLEQFLPNSMHFAFILPKAEKVARRQQPVTTLDIGIAQSTIRSDYLEKPRPSPSTPPAESSSVKRRLPVFG